MNIGDYLKQTAVWHKVTGRNEYGEPVMHDSTILVRWEAGRRLVRNARGEEVISEALVFCLEPVQPGDRLTYGGRTWTVLAVGDMAGLDGQVLFREVAV